MMQQFRKRIMQSGIICMLGFTVCGCGSEPAEEPIQAVEVERQSEIPETKPKDNRSESPENRDEEILEGDVFEIGDGQFTVSKYLQETDENGGQTVASSVDGEGMEKVLVQYDENISFTKRIIRNGGADYEDVDSSPKQLEEGIMVKVWGYYDRDVFQASEIQLVEFVH